MPAVVEEMSNFKVDTTSMQKPVKLIQVEEILTYKVNTISNKGNILTKMVEDVLNQNK